VKELRGRASALVPATPEDCFAFLAAVDRYPAWFEYLREVSVLESDADGRPVKARARVHVPQSPFGKDFQLVVTVHADAPSELRLVRVPQQSDGLQQLELAWRLRGESETMIELEFAAVVSFLPQFLPLGGAGNVVAQAMLEAASKELGGE
jgi:ribosome-associated toxin RatA of RatAB toxin-antitoxin module